MSSSTMSDCNDTADRREPRLFDQSCEIMRDGIRSKNLDFSPAQAGIPYLLVGAFSSNACGIARSTKDADFVVSLQAGDLGRSICSRSCTSRYRNLTPVGTSDGSELHSPTGPQ